MPWFKIDDKAHSHPKFMRVGNAALGLWLRCGSYSAQHVTEGIVPGQIAQLYGTAPQIAKLVKAGLWHAAGHTCPRCPQPNGGDYVFHDFFEDGRNTSRDRYEEDKQRARDRAAKSRAGRKDDSNAEVSADDSTSKTKRIEDESSSKKVVFSDSTAGQHGPSQRTPAEGVTAPHAAAAPYPGTSFGSTGAAAGGGDPEPRSYDTLGDLKRAVSAAGISGISWDLQASQIERVRRVRDEIGIGPMVLMAVGNVRLKGPPAGASAWIKGWESLEPDPEGVTNLPSAVGASLRAVPGSAPPSHNSSVLARFRERAQQEKTP